MTNRPERIDEIYRQLTADLAGVTAETMGDPVRWVYKPLEYAGSIHGRYIERYCPREPGSVLFMGMNPGPDGMAQTGIPFGAVTAVRDYLALGGPIASPAKTHPKKPVLGFACPKIEPSGKRLWGLVRERFPDPMSFFARNFVINHCPLLFLAGTGSNIAAAQLSARQLSDFIPACDRAAAAVIAELEPRALVGIGAFAYKAFMRIRDSLLAPTFGPEGTPRWLRELEIVQILHPSPASPAANRGWAERVATDLENAGLWERPE